MWKSFEIAAHSQHRCMLVFLLSLTACQTPTSPYIGCSDIQVDSRNFCSVSFYELLGNPDAIDGIDVSVSGFIAFEQGVTYLLPTTEEVENENDEVAIVLDVSDDFFGRHAKMSKFIEVLGEFAWFPDKRNPRRRQIVNVVELNH